MEPLNSLNITFRQQFTLCVLIAGFLILTFTGRNVLATLRRLSINNV